MDSRILLAFDGLKWERKVEADGLEWWSAKAPFDMEYSAQQEPHSVGAVWTLSDSEGIPCGGDHCDDLDAAKSAAHADCLRRMQEGGLTVVETDRVTCPACGGNGAILMRLGREFVTCVICSGNKLITVVPAAAPTGSDQ